MKYFLFIIFSFLTIVNLFADEISPVVYPPKSLEDDNAKILEYKDRCQTINSLVVKNQFKLECFSNYHHYYPTMQTSRSHAKVANIKIAEYNLLHPGTSKALFKDYSLVAKVANHFDVVSGLEVLPTVSHDEQNNVSVLKLLQQNGDLKTAIALYRMPGYMRLLMELKRLDPSWGLILSPRGDAAREGSLEEMVAFFYRGSIITPNVNPHCQEFKDENGGVPYACLINLRANFMGNDMSQIYSRRPFMASFKAGNFNFTLVSNHVVFTYSGDENAQKNLLLTSYGTESISEIGQGINNSNFARFAEVQSTIDFMNRYMIRYQDKNIMYVGDTNLTASIPYWAQALKRFPGSAFLINEPTTISPTRYTSDAEETNGVASSYDHFILNPTTFTNCSHGEVYNYYRNDVNDDIERVYGITSQLKIKKTFSFYSDDDSSVAAPDEDEVPLPEDLGPLKLDYPLTRDAQSKMDHFVQLYSDYLNQLFTVKNGIVVQDTYQVNERLDGLRRRVFFKQLTNSFYYRFYQELLSDHFPVSISCSI